VDARREEFERRYEGLTDNEELKLLKQDIKAAAKKVRALQGSTRRQELHQQTVHQLDYTFISIPQQPTASPM
jgi:hypothetical protein